MYAGKLESPDICECKRTKRSCAQERKKHGLATLRITKMLSKEHALNPPSLPHAHAHALPTLHPHPHLRAPPQTRLLITPLSPICPSRSLLIRLYLSCSPSHPPSSHAPPDMLLHLTLYFLALLLSHSTQHALLRHVHVFTSLAEVLSHANHFLFPQALG